MTKMLAHPVACCCMLLGVDAESLKPVKLLAHVLTDARIPNNGESLGQQCCVRCTGLYFGVGRITKLKPGDFKSAVHSYHLDSDRELEKRSLHLSGHSKKGVSYFNLPYTSKLHYIL